MNRSLLGFLAFLGLLAAAVGVGVWLVGPTLLELAFDEDRREQPYYLLHFSRPDDRAPAPGYRRQLLDQLAADGGRLAWHASVMQLAEGRLRDAWESVDLVEFERADSLVRVATGADFRQLMGQREAGAKMLLGASQAPTAAVAEHPVLLLALLELDPERPDGHAPAELLGFTPSLSQFGGQVAWQAPLDGILNPGPWNYLIMLAFDSDTLAQRWLDDPDTATDRALGRRYLRDRALLWLRHSQAAPHR